MAKTVQRAKSKRPFVGILILVAIAGVGALGYAMSRPRAGIKPVDPNLKGLAAFAAIGNLLLNLDEAVTKE